jgi:hypothetical protein
MRDELKPDEIDSIVAAIRSGDRIKATSLYISATSKGLTDAQKFVRDLTASLLTGQTAKSGETEPVARKTSQK